MNIALQLSKFKKLIIFTVFLAIASQYPAFAQDTEKNLIPKFLLEVGLEYGGDRLLEVLFTNGNTQTMRAGQGGFIALGGQLEFGKAKNLMFRTTIGIKYNTTAADNANIRFTRIPINVLAYWKINQDFRLGAGISTHQSVRLNGDGFFPNVNLKSNLGTRFEFGYRWVALTYTAIRYRDNFGESLSGGSIGLAFSLAFPNN
jgi:hypothetical protein